MQSTKLQRPGEAILAIGCLLCLGAAIGQAQAQFAQDLAENLLTALNEDGPTFEVDEHQSTTYKKAAIANSLQFGPTPAVRAMPRSPSRGSTRCPAKIWNDTTVAEAERLSSNETWIAWAQTHFQRERAHCPRGRTCWAGLFCQEITDPRPTCRYSITELCMAAGNRNDSRCKAVHTIQCPCHGGSPEGISSAMEAELQAYMTAFGREWRAQNPQASESQFEAACDAYEYVSTAAKAAMEACILRRCSGSHSRPEENDIVGTKGRAAEIELGNAFGGGTEC